VSKDFDAEVRAERFERDNTFVIGGETFGYFVSLRPERFQEIIAEYAKTTIETAGEEMTRIVDETIKGFIVSAEDRERWGEVRARDDEQAISSRDMREVLLYLIQEQTGRPTEAPSPSGNGRSETGAASTEPSSSRVVASGG